MLLADPGKKAGWCTMEALVDGGPLEYSASGAVAGDDMLAVAHLLDLYQPHLVIVEDQHSGKIRDKAGKLVTPSQLSVRTLARRRAVWEVLALERAMHVAFVNPRTWQAWAKAIRVMALAESLAGRAPATEDEGVAIVLGAWWRAMRVANRCR